MPSTHRDYNTQQPLASCRFFKQRLIRKKAKEKNVHEKADLRDEDPLKIAIRPIAPPYIHSDRPIFLSTLQTRYPVVPRNFKEISLFLAGNLVQKLVRTGLSTVDLIQFTSACFLGVHRECRQLNRLGTLLDALASLLPFVLNPRPKPG